MTHDDLDRWLTDDDAIVPSSGFADSVMEAVRREASEPAPIPFPWGRALPGLVALSAAMLAAVVGVFVDVPVGPALRAAEGLSSIRGALGWVVLGVLVAVAPVLVSLRLTRRWS